MTTLAPPAAVDVASTADAERRFRAMGTDVHVVVVGDRPHDGYLDLAERAVRLCEARWSRFLPDSELSRLNANPGRLVVISPDTFTLVSHAIDAYYQTTGAFDPTVLGSMIAAGYDRTLGDIAPGCPGRHQAAPSPIGIELDPDLCAIRLPEGVGLDLGGIAKGAAADAVCDALLAAGADGCCINIGGDLRACGRPPSPRGWTVTLACPGSIDGARQLPSVVALTDGAVCTSSSVARRWQSTAGPEHHLRDPATGAPLERGLRSVSVISARATQAEVLTKAALAAGPDGAPEVICDRGATGVLIDDSGRITELGGFSAYKAEPVAAPDSGSAELTVSLR